MPRPSRGSCLKDPESSVKPFDPDARGSSNQEDVYGMNRFGRGVRDILYRKRFEWGFQSSKFLQVNIETTTVCTRTCHFCLYGLDEKVPATRMDSELFFSIIDELSALRYAGRLSLFNINEPLTDRRIFDFLHYARTRLPKAYHALVSNGDLLNLDAARRLFESGLDQLMLNSYDEPAKVRNLALIESLGDLGHRVEHMDRTTYTEWHSRAGNVAHLFKGGYPGFCELPNYVLYIKPNGDVLSCCNDFFSKNVLGNVARQGVEGVWRGETFRAFRAQLNRGDRTCSSLCSQCDYVPNIPYFAFNAEVARGLHRIPRDGSFREGPEAMARAHAIREQLCRKKVRKPQDSAVSPTSQ